AFKALFGDSFVVLPTFDPSAPDLPVAAFDGSTLTTQPDEARIWLWLQQVAETRPRVRVFESLLLAAEAWSVLRDGAAYPEPLIAQLPSQPLYGWQALADAELGTTDRPAGCQSIVAFAPPGMTLNGVAGFVIDEWTETIPSAEVVTGVSFEYNQP